MALAEERLEATIKKLQDENKALSDQLAFARQKASLYYITASELDSLKRVVEGSNADITKREAAVDTADLDSTGENRYITSLGVQTDLESELLAIRLASETVKTENELLKTFRDNHNRTERLRIRHLDALAKMASGTQVEACFMMEEYAWLFEAFISQNRISINHSIEIKRRDEIISSLFEKIRMIESCFNQKLMHVENIAANRQVVINELSSQIREAVRIDRETREWVESHLNEDGSALSWTEMAAMHSELEDLKAELSMARTNWAATRDELVRLQFRVGVDGSGNDTSPSRKPEYPAPTLAIIDADSRPHGLISGIRNLRNISSQNS